MKWTLVPLGLAWGAALGLLFRRLWDPAAVRIAVNSMVAHVLEFRLFLDEPALVLHAQLDLFRANGRLLRAVALPTAMAAITFALAYSPLDRFYGHGALPVGKAAVVTVRSSASDLLLRAPDGVEVETPGVRAVRAGEVSWRVRPTRPFTGSFRAIRAGRVVDVSPSVTRPQADIFGVSWGIWFTILAAIGFRRFA